MGVMHKIMSFFGLAEERIDVREPRDYVDYEQDEWADEELSPPLKLKQASSRHNVVSLQSVKSPPAKIVLSEPRTYDETQDLADHLRQRKIVVTNLQRLQHEQAKRVVDFLSGTVYALGGDIQKVGPNIFLCIPDHVEIHGAISEMVYDDFQSKMR